MNTKKIYGQPSDKTHFGSVMHLIQKIVLQLVAGLFTMLENTGHSKAKTGHYPQHLISEAWGFSEH